MRALLIGILCYVGMTICDAAVLAAPPGYVGAWPPPWVGVKNGADNTVAEPNPTEGDESHDFDYGKDQWGYWANLEVSDVIIEMRYIPVEEPDYGNGKIGGAFLMGAPPFEQGARENEMPQVAVDVSDINGNRAMWVAADECSQALWEKVTGNVCRADDGADPVDVGEQASFVDGEQERRAVDYLTYRDAQTFCASLTGIIGNTVEIPTEKEWEYLCRSGTATAYYTGRILEGFTGFSTDSLKTTADKFMYDFSRADMDAGKLDVPKGDEASGGLTPPWEIYIQSVDGDGIGRHYQWHHRYPFKGKICGEITITGSSTIGMNIVAQFDSRFQHHYKADHFGAYTPILMVYYYDGTNYIPMPYADPSSANMYYRYLNDKSKYVAVAAVEGNLIQNQFYPGLKPESSFGHQESDLAGDWHDGGGTPSQLEYREMVYMEDRYRALVANPDLRTFNPAEWVKAFDGTHILVYEPGVSTDSYLPRMHPIRSTYTPYRFYKEGTNTHQTLPIQPTLDQIEQEAMGVVPENQKGKNGPNPEDDMTVTDYIDNYLDAIDDYYDDNDFDPGFWEPQTEQEKRNIKKSDIVKIQQFVGFPRSLMKREITVIGADTLKSSIAANGRSPWGLLNMHGNLEEWTATTWDGKSNHAKHTNGPFQVTRGGSWRTSAERCRSAARTARDPAKNYNDVGFRFIIRN